MDSQLVERVALALRQTARNRTVMPYQQFHALLLRCLPLSARYEVLEAAAQHLQNLEAADYGVLLTLESGLPGRDFFARFRKRRFAEYVLSLGDPRYTCPTAKRKRQLVENERARVYQHATANESVATH